MFEQKLINACDRNHSKIVKLLLLFGFLIDVNKESEYSGITTMEFALSNDNIDIIKLLIRKGADFSPYLGVGNMEASQLLLKHGANVNKIGDRDEMPIVKAAMRKSIDVVSLFIKLGGSATLALGHGNLEMAKLLIQKGADLHAKDENGKTPLMKACSTVDPDKETAKFFIDKGNGVNDVDKTGKTALMWACEPFFDKGIFKTLIKYGANPQAIDHFHRTVLMWACKHNKKEFVDFLLNQGVELNAGDKDGSTALSYASSRFNHELVDYLKEKGAVYRNETARNVSNSSSKSEPLGSDWRYVTIDTCDE
ncbi:ankyrin repeat domain-containing protein [bacterium]|nr:ankyrin repeat domain-containing protein [bacterium]